MAVRPAHIDHAKTGSQERTCLIFNPTARGDKARRALRELMNIGLGCTFKPTVAAGSARSLAAEAVRDGFETIVAAGGDGTVHEVLNGIADEPEGLQKARLAVLPIGTVNVFARELGVPLHYRRAWEIICQGRESTIDVPRAEFQTQAGPRQLCFVQMAGCGLDARAVELLDWELKKRIGQFAYLVSGAKALRERTAPIHAIGQHSTATGQLVLIGNGRLYGGPVPLFHRAELRDGLLDVCVFPRVNWFVILRYACAYLSPKLLHRGPEQHFQTPTLRLESASPAPLELDGEFIGRSPASLTVVRNGLRVVVP